MLSCCFSAGANGVSALGHAVLHLKLSRPLTDSDSLTVHPFRETVCDVDDDYGFGRPFKVGEDTSYFETHVMLPDDSSHSACLRLHSDLGSTTIRFDDAYSLVVDPTSTAYGNEPESMGTPVKPRLVQYDETSETPPPIPPPLTMPSPLPPLPTPPSFTAPPPRPMPPSATACSTCMVDGALANPFCDSENSECSVGTIDSVLRLVKWLIFPNVGAYEIGDVAAAAALDCLSALEAPRDTLTTNDVISYTRYRLVASSPPDYRCLSSFDD